MTKKQFLFAIQRGLGRGILAVKENPQKFRDLVLKYCTKNFCFDTQCEGVRAWYTYQMISCYEDTDTFVKIIAHKFLSPKSKGWLLCYLSELLAYFAKDGSAGAKSALWTKYDQLYQILASRQRAPKRGYYFAERDDFESLCINLSYDFDIYRRIAKDIGSLYLTKSFYHGFFDSLYSCNERKYNALLKKEAKNCPEIKRYIEVELAEKRRFKESCAKRRNNNRPLSEYSGYALSWQLKREDASVVEEYANRYLNEPDAKKRAEALHAFVCCPFPFDPTPIIEDTGSQEEELRDMALRVLEKNRHPFIREFALQQLEVDFENALSILIRNYLPEDEEWLYRFISELKIDYEENTMWHSYHFDIQDLFDKEDGIDNPPKRFLPLIYEQTLCSCCRMRTLKCMGKLRILTPAILNECLYDSDEDIRKYAEEKLKNRK